MDLVLRFLCKPFVSPHPNEKAGGNGNQQQHSKYDAYYVQWWPRASEHIP